MVACADIELDGKAGESVSMDRAQGLWDVRILDMVAGPLRPTWGEVLTDGRSGGGLAGLRQLRAARDGV
jgi:hypothetical protein